jgi:hypothetical protein
MEGLIALGLVVVALAVFVALALRFGVDSRPDFGDRRARTPGLSV